MTRPICFVTNSIEDFPLLGYCKKYLSNRKIDVVKSIPKLAAKYDAIILWNIQHVIYDLPNTNNVLVFHSSDLPKGKGWAPIAYSILKEAKEYCVTAFLASDKVDSGDIIAKARFVLQDHYLATDLRNFDEEICVLLLSKILKRFAGRQLVGIPQKERGTYYPRRFPEDNIIDASQSFASLLPLLRAGEDGHHAFININEKRFYVTLTAENAAQFPKDLSITFFDANNSTAQNP